MTTTGSMTLLRQGFRQASSKIGVLGVLYAINLLITLPLALVFRSALSTLVGEMPAIDQLLQGFDYTVYSDLSRVHNDAITVFGNMFFPVGLASIIVHAIVGVGLARVMDADGAVREFFGGIVGFGLRALRLLLVFVLFGGILGLLAAFLSTTFFSVMTKGNVTEDSYLLAGVLSGFVFAIAVSITMLGAEYGRILTVRENRTSMFKSGWSGLVFVLRHPLRMVALHGTVFLVLIVAALIYWLLDDLVGMTSGFGILIMFVAQQIFIFVRLLIRTWNTANGVKLTIALASATRPSFVKAPSVHDRRTPYREPLEKGAERSPDASRSVQEGGGERRGGPRPSGRDDRPGYRRRGRRRGGGGGARSGGPTTGAPPKPDAKPPSVPGEASGPPKEGPPKSGKPRRRRRPPRRPSGNKGP